MGRIVIVCYKPKPGKASQLDQLMKTHVARLRKEGLVTDRDSILMRSQDGTVIEVFEWVSKEAIEAAHTNPVVQQMWKEYVEVCDYETPANLEEFNHIFSEFESMD